MKLHGTAVLLLALALPAAGGNRADVNGDHAVNVADQLVIAHILAGNLDVGNYALENVVVVAPQGGDFDDPADAADWVALQGPGPSRSFVILVTPGYYYLDRAVKLPEYTVLKGYSPERTFLLRDVSEDTPPYGAVVSCDGAYLSVLEGLRLEKTHNPGIGTNLGLYVHNCEVTVRNCRITVNGDSTSAKGILVQYDSGAGGSNARLNMTDTEVSVTQGNQGTSHASGVHFLRSSGTIGQCRINVENWVSGKKAHVLYQDCSSTNINGVVYVKDSYLSAAGNPQAIHYYLYRPVIAGNAEAYFSYCEIRGERSTSTAVFHIYCHSNFTPFP